MKRTRGTRARWYGSCRVAFILSIIIGLAGNILMLRNQSIEGDGLFQTSFTPAPGNYVPVSFMHLLKPGAKEAKAPVLAYTVFFCRLYLCSLMLSIPSSQIYDSVRQHKNGLRDDAPGRGNLRSDPSSTFFLG